MLFGAFWCCFGKKFRDFLFLDIVDAHKNILMNIDNIYRNEAAYQFLVHSAGLSMRNPCFRNTILSGVFPQNTTHHQKLPKNMIILQASFSSTFHVFYAYNISFPRNLTS